MTPRKNIAHSVRQRLLNHARSTGQDFNQVLLRFANERMLYRLGASTHVGRFLLKGATLFLSWNESKPHRPTRDVDLLGYGGPDASALRSVFEELCGIDAADGIQYDPVAIDVRPIREDQRHSGLRVDLEARLHGAKVRFQFDVGFGDLVTPAAEEIAVPTIREGFEPPRLKAYPPHTVVAEKLEAMHVRPVRNRAARRATGCVPA